MGLTGLTVSIVAVVVYLLALLRLRVSIRLLHPGQKNPQPPPPMVIQNVEDMGGEHTTERNEFIISVKGPGGRGGLQPPPAPPPPNFGQQDKIWTKPGFKDVSMFF